MNISKISKKIILLAGSLVLDASAFSFSNPFTKKPATATTSTVGAAPAVHPTSSLSSGMHLGGSTTAAPTSSLSSGMHLGGSTTTAPAVHPTSSLSSGMHLGGTALAAAHPTSALPVTSQLMHPAGLVQPAIPPKPSMLDHLSNFGGQIANSQAFGQIANMAVGLGTGFATQAINSQMPLDKLLNKAEGYERTATSDLNNSNRQQPSAIALTSIDNALRIDQGNLDSLNRANLNQMASNPGIKGQIIDATNSLNESVGSLRDLESNMQQTLVGQETSDLQTLEGEISSFEDSRQWATPADQSRQMSKMSSEMSKVMTKANQNPYKTSEEVQDLSGQVKTEWQQLNEANARAAAQAAAPIA